MLHALVSLSFCQEDEFRPVSRMPPGGYGAYNAYISAATRYAALGAPTLYDHPGSMYGSKLYKVIAIFTHFLSLY